MARKDDEREFRLRPAKPRVRQEGAAWATGFKLLMHYARTSRGTPRHGIGATGKASRAQRCAVRVVYSKNTTKGQWRAHGRYLARETASYEKDAGRGGFGAEKEHIDIAGDLERWQAARDPLLWKLIVSPEFGERADLSRLTRELMQRMANDLETDLEWVAVAHYNTEHPHVHIALRGVRADGKALQLDRQYIKSGIRNVAEELCTLQLGYRTEMDASDAERREMFEHRFTSLDRRILRIAEIGNESGDLVVSSKPASAGLREFARIQEQHVSGRLAVLESMGLATATGPTSWRIERDLESVLRAMQRTNDHQRMLAAHGVLASDERLPIKMLQWSDHPEGVQGRVLVHGQEELSGRNYLMLEGTDAQIHFIQYTPEMEVARSQGRLRANSFLKLRRIFGVSGPITDIQELGDADAILTKRRHFEAEAQQLIKLGLVPTEDWCGGWLGQYQASLHQATLHSLQGHDAEKEHEHHRNRGLAR